LFRGEFSGRDQGQTHDDSSNFLDGSILRRGATANP
jgi:hypothetical protein